MRRSAPICSSFQTYDERKWAGNVLGRAAIGLDKIGRVTLDGGMTEYSSRLRVSV
jgi:hypothetical protein